MRQGNQYYRKQYDINTDEIAEQVCILVGRDIFKDTRKREYFEGRAVYIKILRDFYRMNIQEIAEEVTRRGKPLNHCSVVHALKMFPTYLEYSKDVKFAYDMIRNRLGNEYCKNIIDILQDLPTEGIKEVERFAQRQKLLTNSDI